MAVFDTAKAAQDGAFKGGEDQVFDLKNDGVGLGKMNAEGQPSSRIRSRRSSSRSSTARSPTSRPEVK